MNRNIAPKKDHTTYSENCTEFSMYVSFLHIVRSIWANYEKLVTICNLFYLSLAVISSYSFRKLFLSFRLNYFSHNDRYFITRKRKLQNYIGSSMFYANLFLPENWRDEYKVYFTESNVFQIQHKKTDRCCIHR